MYAFCILHLTRSPTLECTNVPQTTFVILQIFLIMLGLMPNYRSIPQVNPFRTLKFMDKRLLVIVEKPL